MVKKKSDWLRFLALIFVVFGILYFYLNFFVPSKIYPLLRIGILNKPYNILLVGTDFNINKETRDKSAGRTDTILFIHFNPYQQRFYVLSIPRDSYVEIPGYGMQKINSAFALGGMDLTRQTIENLLSRKIDKYIIVNASFLSKTVDLAGGVEVDVDKDMHYKDTAQKLFIDLKKGTQKLNGEQAEGFIRFRMDPMGDIARIERQQKFFRALFKKTANPLQIFKATLLLKLVHENFETDLSLKEIVLLLNSGRMLGKEDIQTYLLPGNTIDNGPGNWFLNRPEIEKLIERYF